MLTQGTLKKMHAMKMHAMAQALEHQIASHEYVPRLPLRRGSR